MRSIQALGSPTFLRSASVLLVAAGAGIGRPPGTARADDFFEARIRPLLVERCFECHAGDAAEGGLRLDSRRGFDAGGVSGPVVDPVDPERSLLLRLVRHEVADREMPQGGERLSEAALADLARWVARGLPGLPAEPPSADAAAHESWAARLAARRGHWAWQAVRPVRPPAVEHPSWSRTAIDRFLLAAMREAGLEPAPRADRATLVRRLSLALTGLPPTPAEVDAFRADTSDDATEALVDRLLARPAFGEHWAGYWLDLVRFGETGGYVRDYPIPEAWRYRDYCIRAFNADVPYDRLVAEHVAGDLLPPRHNPVLGINEAVLGTGHLRLMEVSSTATDVALEEAQMLESQIDTLGKAFQGLTIACARCHDHKFDAISQRDYYALFGTLASARQTQAVIDDEAVRHAGVAELTDLKRRITAALTAAWREDLAAMGDALAAELSGSTDASPLRRTLGTLLDHAHASADHPLHAFAVARQASRAGQDPGAAFQEAGEAVRRLAAERTARNAAVFAVAADFTSSPGSWHAGGVLPDTLHRAASDLALAAVGDEIVARVIGPGFASDRLSRKHGATVRSEDFPLDVKFISLRVAGGDAAQIRLIQHNFQQMENVAHGAKVRHVDSRLPTWVTLPVGHQASWQAGRSYLEVVTKDDVAHFRRSDAGDGPYRRTVADRTGRSWFAVDRVVWHDAPEPPGEELEASLLLVPAAGTPADGDAVAGGFVTAAAAAVEAFGSGTATTAEARLLNALVAGGLLRNRLDDVDASTRLLVHRFRQVEEQIPRFRRAPSMTAEGPGFAAAVQKRGQPTRQGEPVPRRYLEVLADVRPGDEAAVEPRLALARGLASPANPLTARVMVNRVWSWLFGRGLVATVDNFGAMGEPPSHPELLDFLAGRFVESGWSLKRLIREIVLTEAYRASSVPPAGARERDPDNRLLSHMPIQRLRAETLRDALLAVSGRLEPAMEGYTGPSDRGTGGGVPNERRGVYQYRKREAQDHMMLMFDAPEGARTVGRRESTSVPGQALLLLNNEFIHRQASAWAARSLGQERGLSRDLRIERLFRQAVGREPEAAELEALGRFFETQADAFRLDATARATDPRPWADLCHVLFNTKEFLHVR
jgi:cytochrome c553